MFTRWRASGHRWLVLAIFLALLGGIFLGVEDRPIPKAVKISLLVAAVGVTSVASYFAWRGRWRRYDPSWLAELARQQHPDKPWLAKALAECIRAQRESEAYLRFVSARRPNQPGSAWQFAENLTLEHETEGDLVLDILTHQRIGGVEFLSRLP